MIRALLLVVLLAGPAGVGPAAADPALWVARSPRATVFLLGSMHMLPKNTAWQSPAIRAAADAADAFWFENVEPDDPASLAPSVVRLGITDRALSTMIPPSATAPLDAAAKRAGLTGLDAVETMRPWLAMTVVSVTSLLQAGLDPALGADAVLTRQAKAAGKPIRGLETAERSLEALAGLPDAIAARLLVAALDGTAAEVAKSLTPVWLAGDVDVLGDRLVAKMQREEPVMFQALVVERSRRWVDTVASMLDGTGVVLVTVGVGHLTGPENMIDLLAQRGIRFARVRNAAP